MTITKFCDEADIDEFFVSFSQQWYRKAGTVESLEQTSEGC